MAALTIDSEPSRQAEDELPSLDDRPELPEGAPAASPDLPVTTVMEGLALNPEVLRSVVYVSTDSLSFDDAPLGRSTACPMRPRWKRSGTASVARGTTGRPRSTRTATYRIERSTPSSERSRQITDPSISH